MITFGLIEGIRPQTAPFDAMGVVAERHAAIWIPVRCRGPEGTPAVGVFLPYLWLDDPISIASGREVYGYAKNWGWPRFAGDGITRSRTPGPPKRFQLDAHAIREYGRDERAAAPAPARDHPLGPARHAARLGDAGRPRRPRRHGPLVAGDAVAGCATSSTTSATALADLRSLLRSEVPQIFLRQFRDPSTPGAASQLQIVTAPARIVPGSFSARALGGHRLDVSLAGEPSARRRAGPRERRAGAELPRADGLHRRAGPGALVRSDAA